MSLNLNEQLEGWLESATAGLPNDVSDLVREEILAHYQDAINEHVSHGKMLDEAHIAVMVELGDDAETGRMLRDTYLDEQHYLKAAVISLASPLIVLVVLLFTAVIRLPGMINLLVLDLVACLSAVYVLYAFRVLLVKRYNFHRLDWPVHILGAGIAIITTVSIGSRLFFGSPLVHFPDDRVLAASVTVSTNIFVIQSGFRYIVLGGVLLLGIGFVLLGNRLLQLKDSLFGLRKFLLHALIASGFSIVCLVMAAFLGIRLAIGLAAGFVIIAGLITQVLLTLLFVRVGNSRRVPGYRSL